MRLPNTAHATRPWRIHAVVPDFWLEDAWTLQTPGGPDDFPRLVRLVTSGALVGGGTAVVRALFAVRRVLGRVLGWDGPVQPGAPTVRDRLPADLRATGGDPVGAFTTLYRTDDEWAAEIVNRTVHGILHLGWVPDGAGRHHGEMAVYVRPAGMLGKAYMAAITPVRHLVVYPLMLRGLGRAWAPPARTGRADPVPVPAELRAAAGLDAVDHADAYRVGPAGGHPAEAWMRALFGGPAPLRRAVRAVWSAMGAELAPDPSPGHVFGCPLHVDGPDRAWLAVRWRIGLRGTIVVHAGPGETVVATVLRFDTDRARAAWRVLEPVHRALMSVCLARAERGLSRRAAHRHAAACAGS